MRPSAGRLLVCGLIMGSAAGANERPDPLASLAETIEVRVVNVDVVVTDDEGVPIAGLRPEDFELRVDGKETEIHYFAAIRDGVSLRAQGAAVGRPSPEVTATDFDHRPYLAILFDGRTLDTVGVEDVFDDLRGKIEHLAASTRGVLIARQGRSLKLDQAFSRRPEVLARAVDRLAEDRTRAVDRTGRELLLRRLESADRAVVNPNPDDPAGSLKIEAEAISFLSEIRAVAEASRGESSAAMRDLAAFVRTLAGLPGRKGLLYLGPGFNLRPGEVLLRLWWDHYWPLANELGVGSIESEIVKYRLDQDLVRLVRIANESNVTFYTFDPAGLRPFGFNLSLDSLRAANLVSEEVDWGRQTLMSMASGTGGLGRVDSNRLDLMIDRMAAGFRTYYSLGFEPEADAKERGRIRVRMKHPAYRARHLERFASRSPSELHAERTLAALLTDEQVNPLAVGVEFEDAERQRDGTWILPILLKVPLARVTLLPYEASHVGRLHVVVIAQAKDGDLSDPAHGEVPIEIDNQDLLAAMNRLAGYRMRLRMREGEQRLAIGVRDEITGEESTVNLVVDAGGPTR